MCWVMDCVFLLVLARTSVNNITHALNAASGGRMISNRFLRRTPRTRDLRNLRKLSCTYVYTLVKQSSEVKG